MGFALGAKGSVLARQSYSPHSQAAPTLKIDNILIFPASFQWALNRGTGVSRCPEAVKARTGGVLLEEREERVGLGALVQFNESSPGRGS